MSPPPVAADANAVHDAVAAPHAAGVANRILLRRPEMSGAMAKIADYLLGQQGASQRADTREYLEGSAPGRAWARVLIGYQGYVPFRVSIATDFGRSTARDSWKTDIGRAFGPHDDAADVLSTLINAHSRTLRETAAAIDLPLMKKIAKRLATSSHVDIYGVGGSAFLAEEMQARLYRIGVNTHVWSEVHAGLTSAAIQNAGSVAIGISNSGRTEETIQMLREAGRAGALTVAISNNPTSPLAENADLTIVTSVYEQFLQPDDLSAKHGQLLVLDLLYLLTAQENFSRSTNNLAASALAVATHRRPRRTSLSTRPARDTEPSKE